MQARGSRARTRPMQRTATRVGEERGMRNANRKVRGQAAEDSEERTVRAKLMGCSLTAEVEETRPTLSSSTADNQNVGLYTDIHL